MAATGALRPTPRGRPDLRPAVRRILLRPELTALAGTLVAFAFFAVDAGGSGFLTFAGARNYLEVAAEVGIIAAAVSLLLVAGEFDLSVGAMVGAAGIVFSYPVVYHGWPLWAALLLALTVAALVGLINGWLVVRTGIPSFLVTLATMFVVKGVTLAVTKSLTQTTTISGLSDALHDDLLEPVFAGKILGLPVSIYWWIGLTLVAAYVLDQTRFGNWIYATGGNLEAALKAGVPVRKVKVVLFIATAASATLVAVFASFAVNGADINRGNLKEFQAAVAAVIGGAAITGGYGSPIGAALGALFFGMVSQGFFFTNIDDNWFQAFLGLMLLLAVMVNQYTRRLGVQARGKS
jgi:simple sugar transport system permease protein